MPIHDWTAVSSGIFQHFHTLWIPQLNGVLNGGLLPKGYYALVEQIAGDWTPDVLTLQAPTPRPPMSRPSVPEPENGGGATLVRTAPVVRFRNRAVAQPAHRRARRLAIRHVSDDRLVALIEILSP